MRSTVRIAGGVVAGALVVLVALNVTGACPIPIGPLGEHQGPGPDNARTTLTYDPDRAAVYLTPLVENAGPVPVTIVRVIPLGTTVPGAVVVVGSQRFNSDDPAEHDATGMDQVMLGIQPDPGPGWSSMQPVDGVTVEPKGTAQHEGRALLVRVIPDPTQETTVLRFDVEYAVGPFRFITTAWGPLGTTLVICPADRPLGRSDGCATSEEP